MISMRLIDVTKRIGNSLALSRINLEFTGGTIVCIVGPSGSGKTTLLRIMAGFLKPDSGKVLINEVDIHSNSGRRLLGLVSYVPQDDQLVGSLTIRENIDLALRVQGISREERLRRIVMVSEALGITHVLPRRPSEVSGGERRRASIAVALARNHSVLVMDEPSNSLDVDNVDRLLSIMRSEADSGVLIIVATHDDYLAGNCWERFRMRSGLVQPLR